MTFCFLTYTDRTRVILAIIAKSGNIYLFLVILERQVIECHVRFAKLVRDVFNFGFLVQKMRNFFYFYKELSNYKSVVTKKTIVIFFVLIKYRANFTEPFL